MFTKNDEIQIYYTGVSTRHGEKGKKLGIGLATLPADRFVALRPENPDKEGFLETRLLKLTGRELIINAEVRGHDLRVELVDKTGNVIPRFTRAQSRLIPHDKLRYRVVWENDGIQRSLAQALTGQPLALRFILRGGNLYAFRVVE